MSNEKAVLRKELLSLRKTLSKASLTLDMLNRYEEFRNAKTVFCYVSAHGEVDTLSLLGEISKEKNLTVPYSIDNDGNMIAVEISGSEDLEKGRFGIYEPKISVPYPKEKIDFVIVPGVAFSEDFYRLGYGKGYYDRFLSDIAPFKLGICQKELFLKTLPHNEYDIKMDDILSISL